MIKKIKNFSLRYCNNKCLDLALYIRNKNLMLTIYFLKKLDNNYGSASEEWGIKNWKHIKLWNIKK